MVLKKEESLLALPPPQQVQGESSQDLPKDWKFVINHPQYQIIGNPSSGVEVDHLLEIFAIILLLSLTLNLKI